MRQVAPPAARRGTKKKRIAQQHLDFPPFASRLSLSQVEIMCAAGYGTRTRQPANNQLLVHFIFIPFQFALRSRAIFRRL